MARGLRGKKTGGERMDQQVIEGEFHIEDWKESTIAEFGTGGKLTEAKVPWGSRTGRALAIKVRTIQ